MVETTGSGEGAEPGASTRVVGLLPGTSMIRCATISHSTVDDEAPWTSFTILEPEGWVSPAVDCPGTMYQGSGLLAPDARGVADPLADAPKHFQEEGDRVVQAGYATSHERTFVLLRDDEPVAGLVYVSDDHGGWIQIESYGCSD